MEHVETSHWTELTHDLLHKIVKLLYCYDDYYRFRAVCKQWNRVLPQIPNHPWLVLPFNDEALETRVVGKKIYYMKLPELQASMLRGSCFGWLMSVETDGTLRMLNPFTKNQIYLPPISTFPDIFKYNPKRRNPYTVKDLKDFGVDGNIPDIEDDDHHEEDSNDDTNEDSYDEVDKFDEGDDRNVDSYEKVDNFDEGDDRNVNSHDEVDNSDEGDDDSDGDSNEKGDDAFNEDSHEKSDDYELVDTIYHDTLNGTYRFSNKFIQLTYIKKIITSSPPEDNYNRKDFIVIAIYGMYNRLTFCKYGDTKWTDIPKSQKDDVDCDYRYEDVIFHQDKIYVIDIFTQIFEFDIKNKDTPLGGIIEIPKPRDIIFITPKWKRAYLVGCLDGGLLMVIRHFHFPFIPFSFGCTVSEKFDIYKLEKGAKQWSRVFDLKNYAIFIRFNSSVLMSANIFPNGWENRIHYTDDMVPAEVSEITNGVDMGVFNFNDDESNQLFPDLTFLSLPSMWLV